MLRPLACFPSDLDVDQSCHKAAAYTRWHTEETLTDILISRGIWNHNSSIWAGKAISCLRPCGHCWLTQNLCNIYWGQCNCCQSELQYASETYLLYQSPLQWKVIGMYVNCWTLFCHTFICVFYTASVIMNKYNNPSFATMF
jgi:hypothetical protein